MDVNLSIKGVPAEWAERLRQRAERNHRSLQGELMALVEQAVGGGLPPPAAAWVMEPAQVPRALPAAGPAWERVQWRVRGSRSIEMLWADRQARPLGAPAGLPSAADIVRQARDSRGAR